MKCVQSSSDASSAGCASGWTGFGGLGAACEGRREGSRPGGADLVAMLGCSVADAVCLDVAGRALRDWRLGSSGEELAGLGALGRFASEPFCIVGSLGSFDGSFGCAEAGLGALDSRWNFGTLESRPSLGELDSCLGWLSEARAGRWGGAGTAGDETFARSSSMTAFEVELTMMSTSLRSDSSMGAEVV